MFFTLTVLTLLVGGMFVASVAFAITGMRREDQDFKQMMERQRAI